MSKGSAAVLEARDIVKTFGSTRALRGVSVRLDTGRCLGLIGRNGAGKSTLVSILSGLVEPDSGEVLFDGEPAPKINNIDAWRSRIATVFQHSMVVPQLTVAENVFLGSQPLNGGAVSWRTMRRRTREIMDEWGFDIPPDAVCEDLGVDQLQIVEIARALAAGSSCVLLDEPTAALERPGIAVLFDRVRQLVEHGVAVLYISHHLEEVFEICTDVTVLRDGSVVLEAPTAELDKEGIVSAMVGELEVGAEEPTRTAVRRQRGKDDEPRLVVEHVTCDAPQGPLRDVSLQIGPGERLGVTGLLSAGVATLGEVAAGVVPITSGKVLVDGKAVRPGRRSDAQRAGVGYVPADRQVDGFVGHLGIAENQTMTIVDRLSRLFGILRPGDRNRAARPYVEKLSLVSSGLSQPVGELSGGNQQKVTVGRALIQQPSVISAITPTRGVDVASKSLLLRALSDATEQTGAALLIASDELDDLVHCDRVIVLVRGEVFAEFTDPPFDREVLIAATEGIGTDHDLYR